MIEINLTPELIAALGLPAEGEVTPEAFLAAITALAEKAGSLESIQTQLAEATGKATMAEGKIGDLEAQIATLSEAEKQRLAAALDAELGEYELDDATAGVLRNLDETQRKTLLGKLPKKSAPVSAPTPKPGTTEPPPKPVHDPAAQNAAPTTEQKAAQAAELIKAIQGEGKIKDYTAAREEARRRQPELFS